MALVQLSISALPVHVRTARLVASAVARRSGLTESALDEVRLAVGEACSRAVENHRTHCPQQPITVELREHIQSPPGPGRFEVTVLDRAPGTERPPGGDGVPAAALPYGETGEVSGLSPDIGLAVISGLADQVDVEGSASGTTIRMSWPIGDQQPSETGARTGEFSG